MFGYKQKPHIMKLSDQTKQRVKNRQTTNLWHLMMMIFDYYYYLENFVVAGYRVWLLVYCDYCYCCLFHCCSNDYDYC